MTVSPKFRLALVLVVTALTLFTATSLTAQEVLTNDSLVALKKAGLSDSIIISKIKSSQTKFDVSTQGLIGLKNAGLSDQVIEAVVNARSGTAAPPAAAAPAAPAAAAGTATTKETIYHLAGGKYVELNPAASSMESSSMTGSFRVGSPHTTQRPGIDTFQVPSSNSARARFSCGLSRTSRNRSDSSIRLGAIPRMNSHNRPRRPQ